MEDPSALVAVVQDRGKPAGERAAAAARLAATNSEDVIPALVEAAGDESDAQEVLQALGEALAHLFVNLDRLAAAPLHDFAGPAYLAFDEAVARRQRGL